MIRAPNWNREGAAWPNRELSSFVEAGPLRWHVQRGGQGKKVLLLHGAGAATHSWADLLPQLMPHAEIIAPDLPGHGFTSRPSGRFLSLSGMAHAVSLLLETLEVKPDVIIGHSAGTAVALQMALDGSVMPRRIIGLNPALAPFRGLAGIVFPPMAKLLALNPLTPAVFARTGSSLANITRLIEGTGSTIPERNIQNYQTLVACSGHVAGTLGMMARWDLDPLNRAFARIKCPLTFILGTADRAVPAQETRRLAQVFEQVEIIDRPEGHLIHEEAPEEIGQLLLDRIRT